MLAFAKMGFYEEGKRWQIFCRSLPLKLFYTPLLSNILTAYFGKLSVYSNHVYYSNWQLDWRFPAKAIRQILGGTTEAFLFLYWFAIPSVFIELSQTLLITSTSKGSLIPTTLDLGLYTSGTSGINWQGSMRGTFTLRLPSYLFCWISPLIFPSAGKCILQLFLSIRLGQ